MNRLDDSLFHRTRRLEYSQNCRFIITLNTSFFLSMHLSTILFSNSSIVDLVTTIRVFARRTQQYCRMTDMHMYFESFAAPAIMRHSSRRMDYVNSGFWRIVGRGRSINHKANHKACAGLHGNPGGDGIPLLSTCASFEVSLNGRDNEKRFIIIL